MKKLVLTAGSRESTYLLAPLFDALEKSGHYSPSAVFVAGKGAEPVNPELTSCFGIGNSCRVVERPEGSSVVQFAETMKEMEKIFVSDRPALVLACGSDDAALAAALAGSRLGLPVAAVDAGLRSYERSDAGEVNRMLIDAIAELHFVSEHSGEYNLINEGISDEKVFFAGSLLIDSLAALMQRSRQQGTANARTLQPKKYAMVLLDPSGRSTGKDHAGMMSGLLKDMSAIITVLLPLEAGHRELLRAQGVYESLAGIEELMMIDRPGPGELLTLLRDSVLLFTDIEELQAESTVMSVPCLTMMDTSSRPSTIEIGTNVLVGRDAEDILDRIGEILHSAAHGHHASRSKIPEKWDGAAASRIVAVLDRVL